MLLYPLFETARDEGTTWVRVVGCARDKGDKDEDAKYKGDKVEMEMRSNEVT